LAKEYQEVEDKRKILIDEVSNLRGLKILVDTNTYTRYKDVRLTDLFIPKGGNMNLSKEWC